MTTLPNSRTKLILEPGQPWILYVDGTPIGEWTTCTPWSRGIEGVVNGQVYRIDALNGR